MAEPSALSLTERCRALGLRLTGPRQAILQVLEEMDDHPDVEELHRRVRQIAPSVNLATLYRTIKKFTEAGLLESHSFAAGRQHYERASGEHHDHFIEIDTGTVHEFHSPEIEKLQIEIARTFGFEIVSHRLEIFVRPLNKKRK